MMKTYRLKDGYTLVVSVDRGEWQSIRFHAADFASIEAATGQELAQVINGGALIAAQVDEQGRLTIASRHRGGNAEIAVDAERSSAAPALGIAGIVQACGTGLRAARLVTSKQAPFTLPSGAELHLQIDGKRARIPFEDKAAPGKVSAATLAKRIGDGSKAFAHATRDGRVMITSPTMGSGSSLEVEAMQSRKGKSDAAPILGLIGTAAVSCPYTEEPARIPCNGPATGLRLINQTTKPVELHLATGAVVLPARGHLSIGFPDAACGQLETLVREGRVTLVPSASPGGIRQE